MKRESTWNLGEYFAWILQGFSGDSAKFIGIFGGFIGDEPVDDFKGNPRRFSREIYRKIRGKFKGYWYCNLSHFSLLFLLLLIQFEIQLN